MSNRRQNRDLLSHLPVCLIENILVFLPIRDAIRSSVLSTNWRFRWTTIPRLVFKNQVDYKEVEDVDDYPLIEKSFKTFVSRTLFRHQGPLNEFNITVSNLYSCSETHQWLISLIGKDIKELILEIEKDDEDFDVPSCLFSYQKLTYLKLCGCTFSSPPPKFKGYMYLKTLILQVVGVPPSAVQTVVAHSPLLEILEYSTTEPSDSEFVITAPNLKYLFLSLNFFDKICLSTPLLAKVLLWANRNDYYDNPLNYNYTNFLGGLANLQTLTGDCNFLKFLSLGSKSIQNPLVFLCLKTISLDVRFRGKNDFMVAVRLIVDASATLSELRLKNCDCPKDKSLRWFYSNGVKGSSPFSRSGGRRISFRDFPFLKNGTFRKLKLVELDNFQGWIQERDLVKILLASSPVLEKIVIIPDNYCLKYAKECISKIQDSRIVITEKGKSRRFTPESDSDC